jgi:hypothetical protein
MSSTPTERQSALQKQQEEQQRSFAVIKWIGELAPGEPRFAVVSTAKIGSKDYEIGSEVDVEWEADPDKSDVGAVVKLGSDRVELNKFVLFMIKNEKMKQKASSSLAKSPAKASSSSASAKSPPRASASSASAKSPPRASASSASAKSPARASSIMGGPEKEPPAKMAKKAAAESQSTTSSGALQVKMIDKPMPLLTKAIHQHPSSEDRQSHKKQKKAALVASSQPAASSQPSTSLQPTAAVVPRRPNLQFQLGGTKADTDHDTDIAFETEHAGGTESDDEQYIEKDEIETVDSGDESCDEVQEYAAGGNQDAAAAIKRWKTYDAIEEKLPKRAISKGGVVFEPKPLPASKIKTGQHNITRQFEGKVKMTLAQRETVAKNPAYAFRLLFSDEMVNRLVTFSNQKLEEYRQNRPDSRIDLQQISKEDVLGFLGILIYAGAQKHNHQSPKTMYSKLKVPLYHAVMSMSTFRYMLFVMRLDDATTRAARWQLDKAAAGSEMLQLFNERCTKWYSPGQYLVADETLMNIFSSFPFKVRIPSKPGKDGLLLNCVADAEKGYYLGGEINGTLRNQEKGFYGGPSVVLRLMDQIGYGKDGEGRNITLDRRFTKLSLAQELLKRNMTLVGTTQTNQQDIPTELTKAANLKKPPGTMIHGFNDEVTFVVFVNRPGKVATLMSSLHDVAALTGQKPEIVDFYNITKWWIDCMDRSSKLYNTQRISRRWVMGLLYGILNLAVHNSHIVFRMVSSTWDSEHPVKESGRLDFMLQLGESLGKIRMLMRGSDGLRAEAKLALQMYNVTAPPSKQKTPAKQGATKQTSRDRCHICCLTKGRHLVSLTSRRCQNCSEFVCMDHINKDRSVMEPMLYCTGPNCFPIEEPEVEAEIEDDDAAAAALF